MLIVSSEGGVNIEEIAERNPDAIIKIPVDIAVGIVKRSIIKFQKQWIRWCAISNSKNQNSHKLDFLSSTLLNSIFLSSTLKSQLY